MSAQRESDAESAATVVSLNATGSSSSSVQRAINCHHVEWHNRGLCGTGKRHATVAGAVGWMRCCMSMYDGFSSVVGMDVLPACCSLWWSSDWLVLLRSVCEVVQSQYSVLRVDAELVDGERSCSSMNESCGECTGQPAGVREVR